MDVGGRVTLGAVAEDVRYAGFAGAKTGDVQDVYWQNIRSCIFRTSTLHGGRMLRVQDDIQEVLVSLEDTTAGVQEVEQRRDQLSRSP